MSKNTLLSELINYVSANSSGNVTVAAPTSGLALDVNGTGRFTGQLTLGSTITNGTFTYTLPSATGTLALTSSLGSYVPYTGATASVNLGTNDLTSRYIVANGGAGLGGVINIKQDAVYLPLGNGYSSIASSFTTFDFFGYTGASTYKNFSLRFDGLTNNTLRTLTIPDASGTLALTSNLSAYLPLSGGTLTGALGGTSATFSSFVDGLGLRANGSSGFGSSGVGVEVGWTGTLGYVQAYNRSTSAYQPMKVDGSTLSFQTSGGEKLGIAAGGAATFSSSISGTSIRSSAVGTFAFNTVNNGEFQIYATAADGMIMAGRGNNNDMVITNKNGSDVFRIPSGTTTANFVANVAIGTTTTYARLHVQGVALSPSSETTYGIWVSNATTVEKGLILGYDNASDVGIINAVHRGQAWKSIALGTNSGSNVGIGTTTPEYKLQVNSSNAVLKLLSTSATFGSPSINLLQGAIDTIITATNNGLEIGTWSSHPIIFRVSSTGSTEAMRITSGGEVKLTSGISNRRLFAYDGGAGNGNGLGLDMGGNSYEYSLFFAYGTSDNGRMTAGSWDGSNVYRTKFTLFGNGNYSFAGSNVSDVRLKQDINVLDINAIDKLNQLTPKTYHMTDNQNLLRYGFIAQEVQEILPDLINGIETEDTYLGLDYNGITTLLVKAIQEQQTQIEELKQLINK